MILGGDLTDSEWGNPQNSRAAFEYIRAHPWIYPVSQQEVLAMRGDNPGSELSGVPNPILTAFGPQITRQALSALQSAPENTAGEAAWQAFLALQSPLASSPEQLPALRQQYLSQVYSLLFVANWAEHPTSAADCLTDYNLDGKLDCLLANSSTLALFDSQEGSLTYLFALASDGSLHQMIGPTSQLVVGLSDPDGWDLARGLRADPSVIPGAFADPFVAQSSPAAKPVVNSSDEVTFSYPDSASQPQGWQKQFRLLGQGITIKYILGSDQPAFAVQIPLIFDPWERFSVGWVERFFQAPQAPGVTWSISPTLAVEIVSDQSLEMVSFMESRQYLGSPEDPNREYPDGHYLPMPAALVEFRPTESFEVEIRLTTNSR
jgi:hypothetical protein